MANCVRCHKAVTSGYVLCGECSCEELALPYFIDCLAEDIALDISGACFMCVIGECASQVSGMTCRNGIKTWLLNKAREYGDSMKQREEKHFAFLDSIRDSGIDTTQLGGRLEQAFPYLKRCADGKDAIVSAWQARRKTA